MATDGIQQDKYVLAVSAPQDLSLGQEVRFDLELAPSPAVNVCTIVGTVKDTAGAPVPHATVKITDSLNNALTHVRTDDAGAYLAQVQAGLPQYNVYAIAPGYSLAEALGLVIPPNVTFTADLVMTPDPEAALAILSGHVMTRETPQVPLEGAVVTLSILVDSAETEIGTATTNATGQYVFAGLPPGSYRARASAPGYTPATLSVNLPAGVTSVVGDFALTTSPETSTGTVHGVIRDENGVPLSRALVVLFSVDKKGQETPVAFTYTSTEGVYLFGSVNPGTYKIKATQKVVA